MEIKNNIIGIFIPTFNRTSFLKEALKSLTEQSSKNIEIIVINNGFTDSTAELMESTLDPRVHYIISSMWIGYKLINLISKDII